MFKWYTFLLDETRGGAMERIKNHEYQKLKEIIMNKCLLCDETFSLWVLYHMHQEIVHSKPTDPTPIAGIKKPLTRTEKHALVTRGEARIGIQHFVGYDTKGAI